MLELMVSKEFNLIDKMLFVAQLGLGKYNAVGIIGFNSPEWFYSNIGAMFAG